MAQNFLSCDRDQVLLLPPDLRQWLPEGHLARFVIETVDQLDLAGVYRDYRDDGHGRPAHDPGMMVALVLYSYAIGVTSSRAVERRCVDDVAFRVISANRRPDHATIARFRAVTISRCAARQRSSILSSVLPLSPWLGAPACGVPRGISPPPW